VPHEDDGHAGNATLDGLPHDLERAFPGERLVPTGAVCRQIRNGEVDIGPEQGGVAGLLRRAQLGTVDEDDTHLTSHPTILPQRGIRSVLGWRDERPGDRR